MAFIASVHTVKQQFCKRFSTLSNMTSEDSEESESIVLEYFIQKQFQTIFRKP